MTEEVHLSTCRIATTTPCANEECNWCTHCTCGNFCRGCLSFFYYKTHPDPEIQSYDGLEDEELEEAEKLLLLCCWCQGRKQSAL